MKYCIAVQETLRREIVVEADSLEDASDHVEKEYDKKNMTKRILFWQQTIFVQIRIFLNQIGTQRKK